VVLVGGGEGYAGAKPEHTKLGAPTDSCRGMTSREGTHTHEQMMRLTYGAAFREARPAKALKPGKIKNSVTKRVFCLVTEG